MKRMLKIAVCLAGGLALNAGVHADDTVLPDNPYTPIVARNVFNLNPPPPPGESEPTNAPPAKITLNGFMSVAGRLQALYKVAGTAKPGQPAKDEFYILGEGQRQDDIEVVRIDEKAGLVTFNNHGTVQEIPLANAPASSTSTPSRAATSTAPGFPLPAVSSSGGASGSGGVATFGNRAGRGGSGGRTRGGTGGDSSGGGMNDAAALRTIPTRAGASGQSSQMSQLSPEERMILIMAQTEQYKAEGNPAAKIMPPPPPGFSLPDQ